MEGAVRIHGNAPSGAGEEDRAMSTAEMNEIGDTLERVKAWSSPRRITLERCILETLKASGTGDPESLPVLEVPTRGWPVERALGLLRTDREPPDDEECGRIVEEERWKKYGS